MQRKLDALESDSFDLLVVGGGITGGGVALDAALRGLRVGLIERGDLASGTSSVSTKLIHGGLRYLEHGQFRLVYEALHERRRLLRNAPHLVHPLRFVIPFWSGARIPAWKWRAGLMFYDLLAGSGNLKRSQSSTLSRLRTDFPGISLNELTGGAEYFDAQMDDARLCIEVIHTAAREGAVVANYVEAVKFEWPSQTVYAIDRLTNREVRIRARAVVSAAGPWADELRKRAGENSHDPLLATTKGAHVIAPDRGLPAALLLLHPRDGRVFFVLPWLGKTLIGTTDTDHPGPPNGVAATDEDIDYLLEGHNHYLQSELKRSDLLGHFAGLRPLLRSRPGEPSSRSREFRILTGPTGMITITGGKYTTYRSMAETVTDAVMRRLRRHAPCRTRAFPLLGAPRGEWEQYVSEITSHLTRRTGLDQIAVRHLAHRYGTRSTAIALLIEHKPELGRPIVSGEPDLLAELEYQREHEMAIFAEDFFLRRTRLALFRPEVLNLRGYSERAPRCDV